MKFLKFLLTINILLVSAIGLSQNNSNGIKHYYIEEGVKKEISLQKIEESIILGSHPGVAGFLDGGATIISVLIPEIIKYLPKLFYNPNKYIKESGASFSLFNNGRRKSFGDFTYYKRGAISNGNDTLISQFNFTVEDLPSPANYKLISLTDYKINFTQVKLNNKNKHLNLVLEITLHYFDSKNIRKELSLKPINLKNVETRSKLGLDSNNNLSQLIPPIDIIENIEVKLTEVNARKKDWDKWLELYDTNKDQITEWLAKLVEN